MCKMICIDESSRTNKKHIYKHILDFKLGDFWNPLVKHNLETIHNFNYKDSKMLVKVHNNQHRI